jgi:hypothetical protein
MLSLKDGTDRLRKPTAPRKTPIGGTPQIFVSKYSFCPVELLSATYIHVFLIEKALLKCFF